MKDRELTRLLQAHPEEGLEAAMLEYAPLVKGILCRILPQNPCDREECMADVFVALWRNAAKLEATRTPLRPWLAVAARNRAIDCYNALRRRETVTLDDSLAGFNAIGPREDAVEKALQNGGGQYGTLVLDNGIELSGGINFEKRDDRTFVTGINYELFLTHDDLAGHTATLTLSNLMACNKSIVETDGKSYWHYDYADQTPLPGTYTLTFTIPEVSDAGVRTMSTSV